MANKMENKIIIKSYSKLYLHSDFADINFTFTTDDEIVKVPAHKAILAIASPVFEAMFFGPMKENDVVEIVDADVNAFKEFLQFFYLPEVTLTMGNIEAVARLADKYDMLKCLNAFATFIEKKLSKNNVIWSYQLAISLNNQKLKQSCESGIKTLTNDAFKSYTFLHCEKVVVEQILKLDLPLCKRIDLFSACIEWAKASCQRYGLNESDPKDLKKQLANCFYLFQFDAMTIEDIGMILSNEQYEGLFNRDELKDLICMKTVEKFQSKVFKQTKRAFHWNGKKALACSLKRSHIDTVYIQGRESTWFSTNIQVLLGDISFVSINTGIYGTKNIDLNSKMAIIEYNDHTFASNLATKVLYAGAVKFTSKNGPSVSLPEPIVVYPGKMYEIRVETVINSDRFFHYSRAESESKLDREVTIKFHQNPFDKDKAERGLVSVLRFNRI